MCLQILTSRTSQFEYGYQSNFLFKFESKQVLVEQNIKYVLLEHNIFGINIFSVVFIKFSVSCCPTIISIAILPR